MATTRKATTDDPEIPPPPMQPEPDPVPPPPQTYKYTILNPGNATYVYDNAGHTISGGERVQVDVIDPVAQRYIDLGYLVLIVN